MASRSNLGPLTTTFTPVSSCSINMNGEWQGQSCYGGLPSDAPGCWPTATVGVIAPPLEGWGFYSPGLVCPKDYTTACNGGTGGFSFQFGLFPSETVAGCCPSGYGCTAGSIQTCVLTNTAVIVKGASCTGSQLGPLFTIIPTSGASTSASGTAAATTATVRDNTLTVDQAGLYAPLIQLIWQASDTHTITSSAAIAITTTPTTTTPTPSPTQSPAPSKGLSTGAKVAIGVVVTVLALAAIVAFALLFLRRRRRANVYTPSPVFSGTGAHEATEMDAFKRTSELPATPATRHELSTGDDFPKRNSAPLVELG